MSTPHLNELNNVRQRVGLVSKIIAPLLVAALFYISTMICLSVLAAWTVLSGIIDFFFLKNLYQKFPDLISGRLAPGGPSGERIDDNQPLFVTEPFKVYYEQSSFFASMSYAIIQLSTLCPGAIIINYMVYHESSTIEIAILQSIGSGIGIIAAFATPRFIEWFGLSLCGLVSVWVVFGLVLIGFLKVAITGSSIWLLIVPIILSRIFIWSFEISQKQIIKESVDENVLTKMTAIESYLSHLLINVSYIMAIMSVTPKNYIFLAAVSLFAVFLGSVLYTVWYKKHGKTHELSTLPDILD